jgi:hypothetical protein
MRWLLAQGLVALTFLLPTLPALAAEPNAFIRIERSERKEPVALQTAITKYVGSPGLEVDLVGVVHIGDKSYYEALNKAFEKYDVVLYELVAAEGTRPPKGGEVRMDNPLSMLQVGMQRALQLEHQMQVIDYQKQNFVHADLSLDGIRKAIKDRGEDEMTVFFRVVQEFIEKASSDARKPGQPMPDLNVLLEVLRDPSKLKKMMAEQLAEAGGDVGLGKTMNQLLVVDRNKAAIEVLRAQLKAGKKRVAIFYGAAHMPDFDTHLKAEFGLKPTDTVWLTALKL